VQSALASFGSPSYIEYTVDAYANSWSRQLGIDGYTEDCSGNYPCMLRVNASMAGLPAWGAIMRRVKQLQPQVVHSGESYESWEEVIAADADLGGQGFVYYHEAMQQAVTGRDLSNIEDVASSSGADGATVLCYLHPACGITAHTAHTHSPLHAWSRLTVACAPCVLQLRRPPARPLPDAVLSRHDGDDAQRELAPDVGDAGGGFGYRGTARL
jgi:hypothetical protein